jgi:hypothetical protein
VPSIYKKWLLLVICKYLWCDVKNKRFLTRDLPVLPLNLLVSVVTQHRLLDISVPGEKNQDVEHKGFNM